ncbi:MAG: hypothetical protein H0W88_07995 [Parachlamydiaceae bacterium]|nr:hypothetical protein [Parachlamydiaceae bacterium]
MLTVGNGMTPAILSRLEEIPQPLFRGAILPFALETINLAKTSIFQSIPDEKPIKPLFLDRLEKAHQLAIEWYGYGTLALINKQFNKCVQKDQQNIGEKIVALLDPIYEEGREGAKAFRNCVDIGWYVMTLKIYYTYRPQNLYNHALDPDRHDGYKKNILHKAISPDWWRAISPIFVESILHINKKHSLGLLEHKNVHNGTPFQGFAPPTMGLEQESIEILQKILNDSVGKNLFQFPIPEPVDYNKLNTETNKLDKTDTENTNGADNTSKSNGTQTDPIKPTEVVDEVAKTDALKPTPKSSVTQPRETLSTTVEKDPETEDLQIFNINKPKETFSIWNTIANFASSIISILLTPFRFIARLFRA